MRTSTILLSACLLQAASAQKTPYIPAYLLDDQDVNGAQFTWDKTAESDNFTVIWGSTVGTDPASYTDDPDLAFDPQAILDTMEFLYGAFTGLGFLHDAPGTNIAQYKVPVVILNTWGTGGTEGWAFGGDADGVIGAFWAHPLAMQSGHVAAHEFTHSLQAQSVIDARTDAGLGPVWNHSGIFWETHANFMRNLIYPQDVSAWGMDMHHVETWGDWKNTYENYELLLAIMESEGIGMVNRLWRESLSDEYPLQAYKRLAGYEQDEFNDSLYSYVRRMACFDFPYHGLGNWFRQYRANDLVNSLPSIQATYTILYQHPGSTTHYRAIIEQAPEEFAYNLIPLHPHPDSCAVIIKFKGSIGVNAHAGWRYGFVAAHADGTVSRYSPTYAGNESEVFFEMQPGESALYFMVMGAPDTITTNPTNDTWHGYPKHYRFPYELSISGAVPEGAQAPADFRTALRTNGAPHPNGGGWVQNASSVDASVYVGPHAMVLGNSVITDEVEIFGTAVVKNAIISGNAEVLGNAFVVGGALSGYAVIWGRAFVQNCVLENEAVVGMRARVDNYHLHGTIEVGGDVVVYNTSGDCDNGTYYRMTNYYQDNLLECDGRGPTHPDNLDVNNAYPYYSNEEMTLDCHCANLPDCLSTGIAAASGAHAMALYPNPASTQVTLRMPERITAPLKVELYDARGGLCAARWPLPGALVIDISALPAGMYVCRATGNGLNWTAPLVIVR